MGKSTQVLDLRCPPCFLCETAPGLFPACRLRADLPAAAGKLLLALPSPAPTGFRRKKRESFRARSGKTRVGLTVSRKPPFRFYPGLAEWQARRDPPSRVNLRNPSWPSICSPATILMPRSPHLRHVWNSRPRAKSFAPSGELLIKGVDLGLEVVLILGRAILPAPWKSRTVH